MIAKISTGNNAFGMVRYNHEKTKGEEKGTLLGVNNIVNTSFNTIVKTLNDYNNGSENVSKPCIHISLNFHKKDILSDEKIHEIAKDYMTEMGYNEQPYAVYRHFDKEHPHVHIVSSQVNFDKKKINDSYIYYRSQALTRQLEEKYNITKAVGENAGINKGQNLQNVIYEHLEFGKHSLTAIMKRAIEDVLEKKPTTEKQFEYLLSDFQIKRLISYEEDQTPKGHFFDLRPIELLGLKEENIQYSKGIYGSDLDPNYSYQAILAQIHLNNLSKEALQKNVMGIVYSVINPIITRYENSVLEQDFEIKREKLTDFITSLKKKGIHLEIKRTQTGDDPNSIYGILFKDIKSNHVYSASEIKLKTKEFLKYINDDLKSLSPEQTKQLVSDIDDRYSYLTTPNFNSDFNLGNQDKVSSIFDFAVGFFESSGISTPYQEEPPKRKPKRKRL